MGDLISECAARLADGDGHRGGEAGLTGAAKGRVGDEAGSHLHIGIRQDNDRVLGPTRALGTLAVGCRPAVDVLCYWGRADEGDSTHKWVVEQGIDDLLRAIH